MPWRLPEETLLEDRNIAFMGDSCLKGGEGGSGESGEGRVEGGRELMREGRRKGGGC